MDCNVPCPALPRASALSFERILQQRAGVNGKQRAIFLASQHHLFTGERPFIFAHFKTADGDNLPGERLAAQRHQ